jgi:colicin import membrane protein
MLEPETNRSGEGVGFLSRIKADWAVSGAAHAGLLAVGLVSFAAKPLPMPESVAVDVVSATEFSQMTAGSKKAPKPEVPKPKPLVEKIADKKVVEDPKPKIVEKPEIKEAKAEPPPMPEPRPKPPQPAAAKPEPKTVDQIAEALKRDQAKRREDARKEQKKAEKQEEKKEQPRFDPSKVAALLDKRAPQRQASAGDVLNSTASVGLPSASAAILSQSEMDALRARLAELWNPPAGAKNPEEVVVLIRVQFNPDGRLSAPPQVLTSGTSVLFQAARESAVRALFRGQPFNMLRREHYEQWKDIEINFDPRELMRG